MRNEESKMLSLILIVVSLTLIVFVSRNIFQKKRKVEFISSVDPTELKRANAIIDAYDSGNSDDLNRILLSEKTRSPLLKTFAEWSEQSYPSNVKEPTSKGLTGLLSYREQSKEVTASELTQIAKTQQRKNSEKELNRFKHLMLEAAQKGSTKFIWVRIGL